jgi:hypothetical protein
MKKKFFGGIAVLAIASVAAWKKIVVLAWCCYILKYF